MILDSNGEPISALPNSPFSSKPEKAVLVMCKHMLELKRLRDNGDDATKAELAPIIEECAEHIKRWQKLREGAPRRRYWANKNRR